MATEAITSELSLSHADYLQYRISIAKLKLTHFLEMAKHRFSKDP